MKNKTFTQIWEELGNIPVNEKEEIEEKFYKFEKGTSKFDIWHYLEEYFNISIGDYINKKMKRNLKSFTNGFYYVEVKEDDDGLGIIIDVFENTKDKDLIDTFTFMNEDSEVYKDEDK